MNIDSSTYTFTQKGSNGKTALIIGIVFLLISAAGYFMDSARFFQSYLVAYIFWLTFALGGLFYTLVNNLFGSQWNIVMRRINEAAMYSFPLLAILFIPIIFGMHDLYHWTHEEVVENDPILLAKSGYLNTTFFVIRAVVYFAIWFVLSRILYKMSLKQDSEPHDDIILNMRRFSAPGMILFALSLTFASFDWLMSLEPHWYSTIYGLYIFAGSFLAILSLVIIVGINLRNKGILSEEITTEHYHDLGKLVFSFLIFWGYMGFSQYFLMWYANIPEETVWYLDRWENSWNIITMLLVVGHFTVPFVILLIRATKRKLSLLKIIAIWVIIMHAFDIFWLVIPTFSKKLEFSWMELTLILGIGGIFIWNFWNNFTSHPVIPVGERRLQASLSFKNN